MFVYCHFLNLRRLFRDFNGALQQFHNPGKLLAERKNPVLTVSTTVKK